eukprot:scaffold35899_cov161-Skeletonema_marinoi.AAC.1
MTFSFNMGRRSFKLRWAGPILTLSLCKWVLRGVCRLISCNIAQWHPQLQLQESAAYHRLKQDLIQKENIIRSLDVESNIQRRERETWINKEQAAAVKAKKDHIQ